ncbi:hypothetical protein EAE96_007142 [Botrytis aclada]|nr:hypothetical protein EAE96_007142 [Botrytis aclada]
MSSRLLTSPTDLKRSKSHRPSHSTSYPLSTHPETSSSLEEKPLPATPKSSTGVLRRLMPRRRDSIALPRVVEGLSRGTEKVRRHSLRAGAGLGLKTPIISPTTNNPDTTRRSISLSLPLSNPKSTTKPLLPSTPLNPQPQPTSAKNGEEDVDTLSDEEPELCIAVEMTIIPVRARLIYIGCRGLDS